MKQYYQEISSRLEVEDDAAQQDGDDDDITFGGSNTGVASNATCPISGKPVSNVAVTLLTSRVVAMRDSSLLFVTLHLRRNSKAVCMLCCCRSLSLRILWRIKQDMSMKERALRVTSEKKEEAFHALPLVSKALLANLHYSLMLHVSAMAAKRSGVPEIGCLVVICLCAQLI